MNLRQLAYFRAVVEHRSLAAAADVLRIAQPNLSTAIKQLESEWGVSLFERSGRGLAVTDTGRALYERAAELLGGASALDQDMRAIGRGFTARLRVGFTQVSLEIITAMVAGLREEGIAVSFSLQQGEPQLLEMMVEERQLDFALTHMPVANSGLGVEALASLNIVLLCREGDDRWQTNGDIKPDALGDVPLILLRRRAGGGIYDRIMTAFATAGVSCSVVADSTDISAIYTLVARNVGLGLLPVHAHDTPRPGFVTYPVALLPAPERLALIYPRGRRQLPAVQRAMDLCRTMLRGS
ncbi:LysR family transcriptional regulator [Bradyrhizobium sp. U87765 SZCCT0131]|uniref:LysR family transcriptional regulator n=1 Tax=unclassified Bradyrhizobium TaxID=2631580 RepID=UPI001BA4C6F3|nr:MULTISPECIES: LysR family transcriptional regulator [unclassified Bradyrhizobium]MBR1221851.1 LysR family transcriptional regulator [Bradyrhizobium sp. U87765 SZCCT0131]MBR1263951.1 LysR family transcriptional regulator [Bradyrhizobium sp. U87765 SZCCT0134]MBR1308266.1 LysR family transcriptional regulator [Bradyrhizobium sp. U87765 SZCCT0110]MBR1320201.1 LysR family transcriptional regulator [Bradyrhizobium sp. U87765 SZCCT0109]MBR1348686.1 LysR family transcriptional regulator [Bradyrhizo